MGELITQWRQRELIAEISGDVVNGMDKGCDFAAEQARGKAPVWRGWTKEDIDYEVDVEGLDVIGYVGVKKGRAFYAIFVELGTKSMAARPFLRLAVFGNAEQIVKLVAGG